MPSLCAIIPASDRPPTLDSCLRAIREAIAPPEQIVVIDDPAVEGPAAARNAGALRADGEVLVFIDSDVKVHPDAFVRIRDSFDHDPQLTAVFGSYDAEPAATGEVSAFRNLLHHHVHQQSAGPADTFWAGLGAIRREPFLATGGFDAVRFPAPSIEDIDLGMRVIEGGGRIELDPSLLGTHLKRWRLREMVRTDVLARGVPWTVALLTRRRLASTLNLSWRHRFSAACALALVAAPVARRPRAGLAALAALVALNRSFYLLLWSRRGPVGAVLGVALHVVHHLCGVAAVPWGLVVFLRERRAGRDTVDGTVRAP